MDFDKVHLENREFTLSGQSFHWRPVGWREQANWVEASVAEVEKQEKANQKAREKAEAEGKEWEEPIPRLDVQLERVIERILHYIEPDERERLKEVIESESKPVSMVQLNELSTWLQEVQAERPLPQLPDSSPGDGTTEATSPDE